MHKILNTIDARKKLRLKKALQSFKINALNAKVQEQKVRGKKILVLQKFESSIMGMTNALNRYHNRSYLQASFRKLKQFYLEKQCEELIRRKNLKKVNELQ